MARTKSMPNGLSFTMHTILEIVSKNPSISTPEATRAASVATGSTQHSMRSCVDRAISTGLLYGRREGDGHNALRLLTLTRLAVRIMSGDEVYTAKIQAQLPVTAPVVDKGNKAGPRQYVNASSREVYRSAIDRVPMRPGAMDFARVPSRWMGVVYEH